LTTVPIEEARAVLERLVGHPFRGIGRAADLVWLAFGGDVPWVNHRGEGTVRPELALHLQCPWRLLRDGEVLVEHRDLDAARFDDRVQAVAPYLVDVRPTVLSVNLDDRFGLRIAASSGLLLEVCPDGHAGREDWRFFSMKRNGPHYVVEDGSMSI
jgi:hypothetical protein